MANMLRWHDEAEKGGYDKSFETGKEEGRWQLANEIRVAMLRAWDDKQKVAAAMQILRREMDGKPVTTDSTNDV